MRHQRSERGGERGERHEQRGSQGRRGQDRGAGADRSYGRQQREDESVSGWQDRDEERSQYGQYAQSGGRYGQQGRGQYQYQQGSQNYQGEGYRPSESYRNDDYDMQSRSSSGGDDYGSREYQGQGYSNEMTRDRQQISSSGFSGRDQGSSYMPSGYGRGSYNEDEYRSGRSSGQYSGASSGRHFAESQYGSPAQSQGRFSGRGPKGYKRSDERIKEEISDMLTRDENIDASEIEIEVKDGEVTLSGTITERRMKHQVEDLVEKCMGVKDITNNLRVQREGQREGQRSQREESRELHSQEGDGERKEGKASAGQVASGKKSASSTANPQH